MLSGTRVTWWVCSSTDHWAPSPELLSQWARIGKWDPPEFAFLASTQVIQMLLGGGGGHTLGSTDYITPRKAI